MRPNFFKNTDGNIAVLFSLALLPILTFVGAAVDYTRASTLKSAMQTALDSASLMVAKEATGLSQAQINSKLQSYFAAVSNRPELKNMTVVAKYTNNPSSGSKIEATATGSLPTEFMRVMGVPSLDLGAKNVIAWGNTRLRVALAMDTTGSMKDDGKIAAMQTASKKLIDQLSANAKSQEDVYISLIPFSSHINIGTAYYSQPWLDWNDWSELNGDCSINGGDKSRTKCGSKGGKWTPDKISTWTGCITDRDEEYDVKNTPPIISNAATLFQPEQIDCAVPIVPLTYDWATLKSRVDEMKPVGATNQPVGMAWAWLSLMPTLPLNAPPESGEFEYKKYMIVLSDGLNTKNKKAGNGSSHSTYVDDRQRLLCDNIKAGGITVYTIQVNTDGDPTSSILQYCATSPDKFYMLTSASQIMSTFDEIGGSMSKLRIAQ